MRMTTIFLFLSIRPQRYPNRRMVPLCCKSSQPDTHKDSKSGWWSFLKKGVHPAGHLFYFFPPSPTPFLAPNHQSPVVVMIRQPPTNPPLSSILYLFAVGQLDNTGKDGHKGTEGSPAKDRMEVSWAFQLCKNRERVSERNYS